jgi:hypothetical protein
LTQTPPETPTAPEGHFAAWLEYHLAPYLADIKADLADARSKSGTALEAVKKAVPVIERVAALLEKSVKAGTLPAEIITEAEAVAAEAATVAGDLASFGL